MALDLSFRANFPGAVVQSGIADIAVLSERNALAAEHLTANGTVQNENAWMGVADETGFTAFTAPNADALKTLIESNASPSARFVVELDWDGDSVLAQTTINGIQLSSLTANQSVDWGHDRPAFTVIIRPAAGRTPAIRSSAVGGTAVIFKGFSKLHIEGDVTFKGEVEFECRTTIDSTRAIPTMVYLKGITVRDAYNNVNAVSMRACRVVHAEDVTLINNRVGFNGAPNYFRCWNCTFYQHRDADMISIRGYGTSRGTPTNDWWSNVWISHLFAWDPQFIGSDVHQDGYQYTLTGNPPQNGQGGAVGVAWMGQKLLFEYSHLIVGGQNAQGLFGDDGHAFDNRMCVHNSFILCEAAQGLRFYDPNDNMPKVAYRTMISRSGGPGEFNLLYDTVTSHPQSGEILSGASTGATATVVSADTVGKSAIISGLSGRFSNNETITGNMGASFKCHLPGLDPKVGISGPAPGSTTPIGAGTLLVKETFNHNGNTIPNSNGMSGVSQTGNVQMRPGDLQNTLLGNGTFHIGPTGEVGYDNPDIGQPNAGAAKASWNAFLQPLSGWNGSGGVAGPTNPNLWPSAGVPVLSLDP